MLSPNDALLKKLIIKNLKSFSTLQQKYEFSQIYRASNTRYTSKDDGLKGIPIPRKTLKKTFLFRPGNKEYDIWEPEWFTSDVDIVGIISVIIKYLIIIYE